MSNLKTETIESKTIKAVEEAEIIEYLEQNPNFFSAHPNLLASLNLHHANSQNTSSLIERQVQSLRKQNHKLQNQLNELINISKDNEQIFLQTKKLITEIIRAESKQNLIDILSQRMTVYFNVDVCELILLNEHFSTLQNVRLVKEQEVKEAMPSIVIDQQLICGHLRENENEFLFNNSKIQSAAIIPLNYQGQMLGLICLGSFNLEHFVSGSQTDFVDFLTDIISERLYRT